MQTSLAVVQRYHSPPALQMPSVNTVVRCHRCIAPLDGIDYPPEAPPLPIHLIQTSAAYGGTCVDNPFPASTDSAHKQFDMVVLPPPHNPEQT